jgi:hypothetical protein
MYQSITIDGATGTEPDTEEASRAFLRKLHAKVQAQGLDLEADKSAYFTAFGKILAEEGAVHEAARWHNTAFPWANRLQQARTAALLTLELVEIRWHSLRTAHAWAAAHHAWIEAVHSAGSALEAWQDILDDARPHLPRLDEQARACYEHKVTAAQRIDLGLFDADAVQQARAKLEETTSERTAITAQTLGALGQRTPAEASTRELKDIAEEHANRTNLVCDCAACDEYVRRYERRCDRLDDEKGLTS